MSNEDIREEIEIELEYLAATVRELEDFVRLTAERPPSDLEKAGAGAFLGQFYGGIENILKRICRHRKQTIPQGPQWHEDLFVMFCQPPAPGLPALFDGSLGEKMRNYRRFRHVFVHGYAITLDWSLLREGALQTPGIFDEVSAIIRKWLEGNCGNARVTG